VEKGVRGNQKKSMVKGKLRDVPEILRKGGKGKEVAVIIGDCRLKVGAGGRELSAALSPGTFRKSKRIA